MTIKRPRATGYYATYQGREYHATTSGDKVILRSCRGEPALDGFEPSRIPGVQGVKSVDRADLERLSYVRTVCQWQSEPFMVVGADDTLLYVFYIGNRGEWIVQQQGMVRTGKLETHGRLLLSEVSDVFEFVNPLS